VYGELLIGLGLVFGVLTRVASVFGLLLMMSLWISGTARRAMALLRCIAGMVCFCGLFAGFSSGSRSCAGL
jgi:uncharacterized membrane protein YphA (DoxX/SURF4 family)